MLSPPLGWMSIWMPAFGLTAGWLIPTDVGVMQVPASQTSDRHWSFDSQVAPSSPKISISIPIVGFTAGWLIPTVCGSQKVSKIWESGTHVQYCSGSSCSPSAHCLKHYHCATSTHISHYKCEAEKHPRCGPHSSPDAWPKLEAPHCLGAEHPTPASIPSKSVSQRLFDAAAVAARRDRTIFIVNFVSFNHVNHPLLIYPMLSTKPYLSCNFESFSKSLLIFDKKKSKFNRFDRSSY